MSSGYTGVDHKKAYFVGNSDVATSKYDFWSRNPPENLVFSWICTQTNIFFHRKPGGQRLFSIIWVHSRGLSKTLFCRKRPRTHPKTEGLVAEPPCEKLPKMAMLGNSQRACDENYIVAPAQHGSQVPLGFPAVVPINEACPSTIYL